MASPVFDKEQYELRGHLPTPMTEGQKTALNLALSRVNGQLDWNAQLLGFNGPNYWGSRIATTDGSYKWKGLPETVSEKRAVQTGAFGVYNKDKEYSLRPAPFNREQVRAAADQTFDIFEENGFTKVVPINQPRGVLYEPSPRLITGGEYIFNALVDVTTNTGSTEWIYVVQDLDQGITSLRLLGDGAESEAVFVRISDSLAQPFLFFIETWKDISDWKSEQTLNQFIGVWGNKGNAIASHFLFDALDIHGFDEEQGLTLDDVVENITIPALLGLVGLVPGPASAYVTDHYNFLVEGCNDLYQPGLAEEFGECDNPNFNLALRQVFDPIPDLIATDPDAGIEAILVASGGDYDGFELAYDGPELAAINFEYVAKTTFGETRFPCIEWIFDPTLDNSTYAPVAAEAAWMGTDDGEYDRPRVRAPLAEQSDLPCIGGLTYSGGFLSFDDGEFDEIVVPNCDFIDNTPPNCSIVDGGFYQIGINPLQPPLSNTECGAECGTVDGGIYIFGESPESLAVVDGGILDTCTIYDNTEYDLVPPSPIDDCIAYIDGVYTAPVPAPECIIEDGSSFTSVVYSGPIVDDGEYITSTSVETIGLSTELGFVITTESDDEIGIDPAIIIPISTPLDCAPCGSDDGGGEITIDCVLDNGWIEASQPPSSTVNDGFYDREINPFCVPCQDPNAPVIPCPVEPLRVRLDQVIFSAPRWRMRPSVMNSLTPLRLWKNRVLNTADPEADNAFINPLVADENSGPESAFSYRHFARLPLEYARNSKFWNRTQAVLANESYFSRVLPTSHTQLPIIDEKPLLYDETYYLGPSGTPDDATFYVEDYLVSTIRTTQDTSEDGFIGANEVYEEPGSSVPYVSATIVEYDAYDFRLLNADGTRVGEYLKWNRRDKNLTGFLDVDVSDFALRYTTSTEPIVSDASTTLIPNIEFPDDPDQASFSNYSVCYAYFVADMSAGDDPVFDPANWISHRSKVICKPEIDAEELATQDNTVILTQDYEPISTGNSTELVEIQLLTQTRYILHDDALPPCQSPIQI